MAVSRCSSAASPKSAEREKASTAVLPAPLPILRAAHLPSGTTVLARNWCK